MSGKYSRDKGRRGEYYIRDCLRKQGFHVDRVPLSGASQGFKGDLKVIDPETDSIYTIEVKIRKELFTWLYEIMPETSEKFIYRDISTEITQDIFVHIAHSLRTLIHHNKGSYSECPPKFFRHIKKIAALRKFVVGCDFLVVKNDRHQPLYIKFST